MTQKARLSALFVLLAVFGATFSGCSDNAPAPQSQEGGEPVIYTTFYPTTYFAETISGGQVGVRCPCPPDEDAIFWMPERQTISEYQKASLIVVNGAGFEKWVEKVSLPKQQLVDTALGLKEPLVRYKDAKTHSHGPAGEHTHEGIDGHTWVDPVNALIQTKAIYQAMIKCFPQHEQAFRAGFDTLKEQLGALDRQFAQISQNALDVPLLCSHPAYNYIARRYNWDILNLDLDPKAKLTNEQVAEIKEVLKNHAAKKLVWESTPIDENIELVKTELGLESVVFSPCELMDPEDLARGEDYITVMTDNVEAMKKVFVTAP